MFKVVETKLSDGSAVFDVTGSIGEQSITLSALNEIHACEIARALNQASAITIEEPIGGHDSVLVEEAARRPVSYADIRDAAPEVIAAWRAFSTAGDDDGPRPPREGETLTLAEQLTETQLRG